MIAKNYLKVDKNGAITISNISDISLESKYTRILCEEKGLKTPLTLYCTTTGERENVPYLNIKSSKGTINNPHNTQAGDQLSGIAFKSYIDTEYKLSGSITTRWSSDSDLNDQNPKSDIFLTTNNGKNRYNLFVFSKEGAICAPIVQVSASDPVTGSEEAFSSEEERDKFIRNPKQGMITFVKSDKKGLPKFQGFDGYRWINFN